MGTVRIEEYVPTGAHQNITPSTVTTLTLPANPRAVLMQAIDQNVRYTQDGTDPTTTKGFRLTAGYPPELIPVQAGAVVKVLQETATAALQYQAMRLE